MMKHQRVLLGLSTALLSTGLMAAPAQPNLSWLPASLDDGSNTSIAWNVWWGENGSSWTLSDNGNPICQRSLTRNDPNPQNASCTVDLAAGSHELVVELCNDSGCTTSGATTVTVAGIGDDDDDDSGSWDPSDLDMTGWPHPLKQNNQPYDSQASGKQVGAYFVEWGIYGRDYQPADIPADNITHLYYGFIPICGPNQSLADANPSGYSALQSQCNGKQDYEVVVHDKFAALEKSYPNDQWDQPVRGIFAQLYRLKQAHPDLTILPSVGGWTLSDPLYDIGTDPAARAVFIESMIGFIRQYDFFDGIDIDWEFPGGGGANPALGSTADGQGFVILMQELRVALDELEVETGRQYQLTAAMSGGVEKLQAIGDGWADAAQVMDHINLMTYDYYGAWNNVLGHQTGLYAAPDAAMQGFSAHEAVQYMLSENVPPQKLSLGVAMYGRGWKSVSGGQPDYPFTGTGGGAIEGSWEAGIQDYKEIEAEVMGGPSGSGINGYQVFWDDVAQSSYAWNYADGKLLTFDTQRSIDAKGSYVLQNNLGGLFAWEIDADNGHLLNSMNSGLGHPRQ